MLATLSLGGNTGDVAGAFCTTFKTLAAHSEVSLVARSSVWRTPPWGKLDQPDFLNMCVSLKTTLTPRALLNVCLAIELAAGRERSERWGPRPLDIDIISYDNISVDEVGLVIPHPRAHERAFVLVPLAEIAPDTMLAGERASDLAAKCDRTGMVRDAGLTAEILAA